MFDPNDLGIAAIYRRAYGEAARLIEIARFDHCFGATSLPASAAMSRPSAPRSIAGWAGEADPEAVDLALDGRHGRPVTAMVKRPGSRS